MAYRGRNRLTGNVCGSCTPTPSNQCPWVEEDLGREALVWKWKSGGTWGLIENRLRGAPALLSLVGVDGVLRVLLAVLRVLLLREKSEGQLVVLVESLRRSSDGSANTYR